MSSSFGDLNDYFLTAFVEQFDRCEDNDERTALLQNLHTPASFKKWVIDNLDNYYGELNHAPAFLSAILGSVDYDTVRDAILDYDSGNFETELECFDCKLGCDCLREMLNMETFQLLCCTCEDNYKFGENYPHAACHTCDKKLNGMTVVFCGGGGGACETWYCNDCHEKGTDDCLVCKDDVKSEQAKQLNDAMTAFAEGMIKAQEQSGIKTN